MSRKRLLIGAGAVVILVAIVIAVVVAVQSRPPEVEVAEVTSEDLSVTVVATGRVEADSRADVVPPTSGTLESVEVTDGQRVKAGQTLATMDTEQLEAQLRQAESAERAARAQLSSARNAGASEDQLAQADDAVAQAKQNYEQTAAAAKSLEDALAQIPQVPEVPGVPVPDVDTDFDPSALTDALVGQSFGQYQAALAQRDALANVDTAAAEAAAEAQVEQASEQVRIAQELLDKATLTAPISGTVIFNSISGGGFDAGSLGASALGGGAGLGGAASGLGAAAGGGGGGGVSLSSTTATEGASVSPAQPPFTVVEFASLRFSAEVDEADVVRIKTGLPATIRLDAFTDREFETKVSKITPQSQPTATGGTVFPVLLPLYDTGAPILLGMQGDATIRISTVPDAITIPIEGLQEENGRTFVYVIEDERLRERRIRTGVITETRVQVADGLRPGDEIVVAGPEELREGMRVSVGG